MKTYLFAAVVATWAGIQTARAELLAAYPFNAGSSNSVATTTNAAAGPVTDTKAYIGISATASNLFMFAYDGASPVFSTNAAGAIAADRYATFTLTAAPGRVLQLETIAFRYGGSSGSTSSFNSIFHVRSSADNYASALGTTPPLAIPTNSPSTNTPGFFSLDLSSVTNVQGRTSITFRIYGVFDNPQGFSTGQVISVRLDDIEVSGSAPVTPTLALYRFPAGSLASEDFHLTSVASNVTSTKSYISGSASASNLFILAYDGTTPVFSTNFTDAVTNARYAEFTVLADPGLALLLESLSFRFGGSAGSTSSFDAVVQVRSSADNFAVPLGTSSALPIPSGSPSANTPALFTLDLASNTNVQGATSITFRIYAVFENRVGFSSAQSLSVRVDDIALRGATVHPAFFAPPVVDIGRLVLSPSNIVIISTGTNEWRAIPEYTTNLLTSPQFWTTFPSFTNMHVDGTNTVTADWPAVPGPIYIRMLNVFP